MAIGGVALAGGARLTARGRVMRPRPREWRTTHVLVLVSRALGPLRRGNTMDSLQWTVRAGRGARRAARSAGGARGDTETDGPDETRVSAGRTVRYAIGRPLRYVEARLVASGFLSDTLIRHFLAAAVRHRPPVTRDGMQSSSRDKRRTDCRA